MSATRYVVALLVYVPLFVQVLRCIQVEKGCGVGSEITFLPVVFH